MNLATIDLEIVLATELTWQQTEFRLGENQLEKCDYSTIFFIQQNS